MLVLCRSLFSDGLFYAGERCTGSRRVVATAASWGSSRPGRVRERRVGRNRYVIADLDDDEMRVRRRRRHFEIQLIHAQKTRREAKERCYQAVNVIDCMNEVP